VKGRGEICVVCSGRPGEEPAPVPPRKRSEFLNHSCGKGTRGKKNGRGGGKAGFGQQRDCTGKHGRRRLLRLGGRLRDRGGGHGDRGRKRTQGFWRQACGAHIRPGAHTHTHEDTSKLRTHTGRRHPACWFTGAGDRRQPRRWGAGAMRSRMGVRGAGAWHTTSRTYTSVPLRG
jgi:hypothetical protein